MCIENKNIEIQPYKYNGKELDQDHGLNWYDYSARYLTNDIPRFTTMDPLADKFYNWSPYVYVYNNPMKFIDPDGKQGFLPPSFFGSPESIKASAIQQKLQPKLVDAAKPAAGSVNLGVSGGNIAAGGASVSNTFFFKGQDQNTLSTYNKTNIGLGTPGFSLSVGGELTFVKGDSFLFNAQSMEGKSKDNSYSIGSVVVLEMTKSISTTEYGLEIESYGLNIGVGTRGLGYSKTTGDTKQTGGEKRSLKKDQQVDRHLQNQEDNKKQQNDQSLWSSFQNFMFNR